MWSIRGWWRGIDYYTRTTFEFTVPDGTGLGTQNALLGGGRYDGLSEMLGGPKAPGIGFAIGEDRLVLALQAQSGADAAEAESAAKLDAFIAPMEQRRTRRRCSWRSSCGRPGCGWSWGTGCSG